MATRSTAKTSQPEITTAKLLAELARVVGDYGRGFGETKSALLDQLCDRRLTSAAQVSQLHELLLLLRAYPDDGPVLERVDAMLDRFGEREDVAEHSEELADSGIAGTPLHYRFYWGMAQWLARRWPHLLHIDWADVDNPQAIEQTLQLLVLHCETPALDTMSLEPSQWFERLKGPDETDAAFLIHRFSALPTDASGREVLYDMLDVPMRLDPGIDTPSRTQSQFRWQPPVFQTKSRQRPRPSLKREAAKPPLQVKTVSRAVGQELIDLARETMVTRQRDLDGINWADPGDAKLIDAGGGLSFACVGLKPERRLMLEAVYVFLILKNGIPVGYFQAATLFGAAEVNYNLFAPWRGAEAAAIYGRGIAVVHHLLGPDVFAVDPYQLGDGNPEAIRTGAFWFYYKLGFRPEDELRKRIVRDELAAMRRNPGHRSDSATLRRLSGEYLYLYLNDKRDDVVGKLHYGHIGLASSRYVARRFGADREAAIASCSEEAANRLGLSTLDDLSEGERVAWQRWSPLVMLLDEIDGWSKRDKRALVAVIRSKGGHREQDFIRRFDRHHRLRAALARLAH